MNLTTLTAYFKSHFGNLQNIICVRSPGRVNLIGEHTDYNDGFVLPIAIDRAIYIVAQPRNDFTVSLYSMNYNEPAEFELQNIVRSAESIPAFAGMTSFPRKREWVNYPKGVLSLLVNCGLVKQGMNAVFYGDIPVGAGLSSSAAIELATAYTAQQLFQFPLDELEMVKLCQQAENEFVGVQCGIMDQFIIRVAKENTALRLDCRTLDYEYVPIPQDKLTIIICNSGVKRGLLDSEYNLRRKQCRKGVELFKKELPHIHALRDVTWQDFIKYQVQLPELVMKRSRHVISENLRVLDAVDALEKNDAVTFGQLMLASHRSLRDDYQVSCRELDILVELAQQVSGCYGARMTGAGFGGCTVNIVHPEVVTEFVTYIQTEYLKLTSIQPEIFITSVSAGINRVSL